jgi:hypothetical protein
MGRTTIQWIAAWTVGCLVGLGPARAQLSKAAEFHGIPVRVVGEFPHGIQVIVGDRVVIRDASDEFVYLKGVYEGSGRGYVLVAEAPGGNGCPEMYRAIDLSAAVPIVSRVFGTCSDVPSVVVTNGALTTTMPGMNGKANIVYRFANGALRETTRPIPLVPTGPDEAPGGDLAALALTKRVDELFLLRAFAAPLLRIMPAASFAEARDMALGGPADGPKPAGAFVVAFACEAHDCAAHHAALAFDRLGHVWAELRRGRRTMFFGDPSAEVRAALETR